jgi:DNA-binding NarL/FixJ family response regulator
LIADADPSFARRIQAALLDEPGIAFVGRASAAAEAVALVQSEAPDLVFVALDMPGSFLAVQRILGTTPRPPRVVILLAPGAGGDDREEWRTASQPLRVSGYVMKTDGCVEMVSLFASLYELSTASAR